MLFKKAGGGREGLVYYVKKLNSFVLLSNFNERDEYLFRNRMKEAIKVNISWDKSSVLEGGDVVLEYAEQGLNGMRGKTGVSILSML